MLSFLFLSSIFLFLRSTIKYVVLVKLSSIDQHNDKSREGIHFEQAKLSRHIHECDNNLREDAHANDDADKVEFLRQSFSK